MNRKQKQIIICLAAIFAVLSAIGLWADSGERNVETYDRTGQVIFSHDSGFYTEDIILELRTPGRGDILYTLDGSVPFAGNDSAMAYDAQKGILLECSGQERIYTVKALACGGESDPAEICSKTYILGTNVRERYDIPVLSISGDPAALFGEEGLLMGDNRYLRGRESEKEIQVTLFDRQGMEAFSQTCGIRVYGSFSREKNQPSFRLYARSEYGEDKAFHYYFFEEDYGVGNVLVSRYKRLILRNSGDDNGYAYLRNELANRLSGEAGFPDVQHASAVCVYLNGEYYGVYWFVNNYDDWYFEEKYGSYDGQMVVLEGQASGLYEQEGEDEVTGLVREEYDTFYKEASLMDLNVEENWHRLDQTMDVENFLQYMALQNYVYNQDFMVNNFRVYRYYSPEEAYQTGTVFDGRYRFLLFDLDESLGFSLDGEEGKGPDALRTSDWINDDSKFSALFRNIMSRPESREVYISYYLSLANYYFAPQRSLDVMAQMHESHAGELKYLYNETALLAGNADMPGEVDYGHVLDEIDKISSFLEERPAYALQDLSRAFDLHQTYELFLSNENQADISVDYAVFHDTAYEGIYFGEVPVTVTAVPRCGYQFDHWLVNGNVIDTERFVITQDLIEDGHVGVECITSPDPEAGLLITAIKSRGLGDYIVLENMGSEELNLRSFFLADGAENGQSSSLPPVRLSPGESVTVYCKNYFHIDALGRPGINFNLKTGETLQLFSSDGTLLQSVDVPQLSSSDNIYRMDPYSGIFYEEIPGT